MNNRILTLAAVFLASTCFAQTETPSSPALDARAIEKKATESFYHPKDLAALDCGVAVNWDSFLRMFNASADPENERMVALKSLEIRVHTTAAKITTVDVKWPEAAKNLIKEEASKKQTESGFQQMMNGFFAMYWAIMDTTPAAADSEPRAEALPSGGYKLFYRKDATESLAELNADYLPVKLTSKSPLETTNIGVQFTTTSEPTPGDRFRFSGIDLTQSMGMNSTNVGMRFTHQLVDGLYLPKTVTISVPGAFSVDMELVGCRATIGKSITLGSPSPKMEKKK